jgi:hypothetical protein
MTDIIIEDKIKTETPDKKERRFKLPKEVRYMMVKFLESKGRLDIGNSDDEEVSRLYNEAVLNLDKSVKELEEKVISLEVTDETKSINNYITMASRNESYRLTDKNFIMRLNKMSVPYFYLSIFKDSHSELTEKDLWEMVNKSGINPINEVSKLTKMKRSEIKR